MSKDYTSSTAFRSNVQCLQLYHKRKTSNQLQNELWWGKNFLTLLHRISGCKRLHAKPEKGCHQLHTKNPSFA